MCMLCTCVCCVHAYVVRMCMLCACACCAHVYMLCTCVCCAHMHGVRMCIRNYDIICISFALITFHTHTYIHVCVCLSTKQQQQQQQLWNSFGFSVAAGGAPLLYVQINSLEVCGVCVCL
eukprot:GHVS01081520.1.p2 GENE.GHVS01081520.1~~GHVS01081520.1.p2  ORF type:complete len:120 (-),score=16.30 GHVS01081520.1:132-491(-)